MTTRPLLAATALLAARSRRQRLAQLPEDARPRGADDAYAVQDAVVAATGPIAAWKVGAKSPADEPQCAPICAAWVHPSPAHFAEDAFALNGIEAEIAFTLARDLPPRGTLYTEADVRSNVLTVHPVIEVIDSRYVDFRSVDPWSVLADFVSHGALVVGPGVPMPERFDVREQDVELDVDGKRVAKGRGSNPAGDPFRLLAWLANHAASRCGGLRRNTIVTTGSWTGLSIAPPGARVIARFAGIGEARIE
jgi:2-keto-4-pentenoate hydratase